MSVPGWTLDIIGRLERAGFEAVLVGGCVRDMARGAEPADWDVATNALPRQVEEIFSDHLIVETGLKHGTVTVLSEGRPAEITTYRADGAYLDHRKPGSVSFVSNLEEDLKRRDFTVNAMAYSPSRGIIDPFGGRRDLEKGILRAVGDPGVRFEEDALRILRGVRFCSTLGLAIEPATMEAMEEKSGLLACISGERIFSELKKLCVGQNVLRAMLDCAKVMARAVPEIGPCIGFDQRNRHHIYDVWEHTARAVACSESELLVRLTLFFHDVGKPPACTTDADGERHFYGHAKLSAEMTEKALKRLKSDKKTASDVVWLVAMHDYKVRDDDRTVRRLVSRFGFKRTEMLLKVKRADSLAHHPDYLERGRVAENLLKRLAELRKSDNCLSLKDLAINGGDLAARGYKGPEIGRALDKLLEAVVDGKIPNERRELLKLLDK